MRRDRILTAAIALVVIVGSFLPLSGTGGALTLLGDGDDGGAKLYSGRAYALGVKYPGGEQLTFADTGPEAGAEYFDDRQLVRTLVPNSEGMENIIDIEGAQAFASAPTHPYSVSITDRANSESYVGNITIFPNGDAPIRIAGILSGARADCTGGLNGNESGTAITALQIGDERIGIGVNTIRIIDSPENDAVLVFNERRTLSDGTKVVNGVRITSPAGEIIINHVEANCVNV